MGSEKRRIDANALIAEICKDCGNGCDLVDDYCILAGEIMKAPTVEAVEVVHGRWVWISDSVVSCSQCNRDFYSDDDVNAGITWFYCPNCGADMRERETEDDN